MLCSDNIFIFHLTEKCFWQLTEAKVHKCSAMRFRPHQSNNLLIGNESGFVYELGISEYDRSSRAVRLFILMNGHEFYLFSPWNFIGKQFFYGNFINFQYNKGIVEFFVQSRGLIGSWKAVAMHDFVAENCGYADWRVSNRYATWMRLKIELKINYR